MNTAGVTPAAGDKFVTVTIDLTPVRDPTGPTRLLDMFEGRSKAVFESWLDARTPAFLDGITVVAMDGFTGFKTATADQIPAAVAVMDLFRVVALADDALDRCRQRVHQDVHSHPRSDRRSALRHLPSPLRTGLKPFTDRQRARSWAVFAADKHAALDATW